MGANHSRNARDQYSSSHGETIRVRSVWLPGMTEEQIRWVLLDRDGTLCERHHYLTRPDQVRLLPGVATGLQTLRDAGLRFVIITNQSIIGRGLVSPPQLQEINERLEVLLLRFGIVIQEIFVCPHTPSDGCTCRKPLPALLERAASEHSITRGSAVLIGDSCSDMAAGNDWGCRTIGISGPLLGPDCHATARVRDLTDAARTILEWNDLHHGPSDTRRT